MRRYDLKNKFVAFNHRLDPDQTVAAVLSAMGSIFIITSHQTVLRLQEKDTDAKLELLFQMKFFPQAILLAKAANFSDEEVNKIYRMCAFLVTVVGSRGDGRRVMTF